MCDTLSFCGTLILIMSFVFQSLSIDENVPYKCSSKANTFFILDF